MAQHPSGSFLLILVVKGGYKTWGGGEAGSQVEHPRQPSLDSVSRRGRHLQRHTPLQVAAEALPSLGTGAGATQVFHADGQMGRG